jgi:hypothetical protein
LQGGKDERLHRRRIAGEHAAREPSNVGNGSVDDVVIDPQSGTLGNQQRRAAGLNAAR